MIKREDYGNYVKRLYEGIDDDTMMVLNPEIAKIVL